MGKIVFCLLCVCVCIYVCVGMNVCGVKKVTSIFLTSSLALGAETMIWRAFGLMNPSSTALSINESKEL